MRTILHRPLICVLGSLFVLLCGLGFTYRASLAQNPPDRLFEKPPGFAWFVFDSVQVKNGLVAFDGWFAIAQSQSWDQSYTILARFMDDDYGVHAELNLGSVFVPANSKRTAIQFHGEQLLAPGKYTIELTANEDGATTEAAGGTSAPATCGRDTYIITVR